MGYYYNCLNNVFPLSFNTVFFFNIKGIINSNSHFLFINHYSLILGLDFSSTVYDRKNKDSAR